MSQSPVGAPLSETALPPGKRVIAGVPWFGIGAVECQVPVPVATMAGEALLVAVIDVRERLRVALRVGSEVSHHDLPFPCVGERLRLPLAPAQIAGLASAGSIGLRLVEGTSLICAAPGTPWGPRVIPLPAAAAAAVGREAVLARHLAQSLHPWGWTGGCVLDALVQLVAQDARWTGVLDRQLDRHLTASGIRYEDPRSQPCDDRLSSIESGLPWVAVALRRPGHPSLGLIRDLPRSHRRGDGSITEGEVITAEGSYTVAYPLMALAAVEGDEGLRQEAFTQLRIRRQRLWQEGALHLRQSPRGTTFRGWSRGVAWYLLGLVRTLLADPRCQPPADLVAEVSRTAGWILPLMRDDGLWGNYVEEPAMEPDTAGSAGIACALALAHRQLGAGTELIRAAERTWAALADRCDGEGHPAGTAPSNKAEGGPALQREGVRSTIHFGLGLVAQLAIAVGRNLPPPPP